VVRRVGERPAKLSLSGPSRGRVEKSEGTLHRTGGERIAAAGRMGQHNPRRIAQRFIRRARSKSLDTSLQRGSYLHTENMRPESALFLSTGPETFAGCRRNRAQSHVALHITWLTRPTGRARKRIPFSS